MKPAYHHTVCEKCGARVQAIMGECHRDGCEYFSPRTFTGAVLYLTPEGIVDQTDKVVLSRDEILKQLGAK